jgi:hypothetical protein
LISSHKAVLPACAPLAKPPLEKTGGLPNSGPLPLPFGMVTRPGP